MSLDPVLRAFGLDFPDLNRSMRKALVSTGWTSQILLLLSAGYIALSKRDYEFF
jgi:hypothetical protein